MNLLVVVAERTTSPPHPMFKSQLIEISNLFSYFIIIRGFFFLFCVSGGEWWLHENSRFARVWELFRSCVSSLSDAEDCSRERNDTFLIESSKNAIVYMGRKLEWFSVVCRCCCAGLMCCSWIFNFLIHLFPPSSLPKTTSEHFPIFHPLPCSFVAIESIESY